MKIFEYIKNLLFGKKQQSKKSSKRIITDVEYNELRVKRQKRIDQILDKISKKGFKSLTVDERQFLDRYSNNQ